MKRARIIHDLTWMVVAILLASFLTIAFDLYERVVRYTRSLESWELDETPFFLFFVAVACAWFACRRYREAVREVDERRQVEKALSDSEIRYRTLVEASAQGIYIHQDGCIRFANRALGRLFGYESAEALIGQDVHRLCAPHDQARLTAYHAAALAGHAEPRRYEWHGSHRDGATLWLDSLPLRITWDGAPALMVTVLDITERRSQEQERRKIAYDIHDGIAQLMVGARHHLEAFDHLWRGDPALAEDQLGRGRAKLHQAIVETRRLMTQLRPVSLETLGLIPAVQQHLNELGKDAGWEIDYHAEVAALNLSPDEETALFRILQEALTNAWKHARTSMVRLGLHTEGEKDDLLVVYVQDWGVGFEPARNQSDVQGFGLVGMRERARRLGGVCSIESRPGRGTTVRLRIPMRQGEVV
jgi:PAS domain S-box-containing protein